MHYVSQLAALALPNKYTKWYCLIVQRARMRATTKEAAIALLGYTEKHHILPKSFGLGGEKDKLNYAYLSAREHLVCHLLLSRMFVGKLKIKMCFALHSMYRIMKRNNQLRLTSWEFSKLREANSYARSQSSSWIKGKNHSKESIEKMRANADGFKKGCTPWNKGLPSPSYMKLSQAAGRKKYRENNPAWADQLREAKKKGEQKRLKACSKKAEVDGVIYDSATAAARALGLKKTTMIYRIKSPTFATYRYVPHV